jgi:hypothetical protein
VLPPRPAVAGEVEAAGRLAMIVMVRQHPDNLRSLTNSETRRFRRPKRVVLLVTDRHMIHQRTAVATARGGKGSEGALLLFCDPESALGSGHGGPEHCECARCGVRADGTRH